MRSAEIICKRYYDDRCRGCPIEVECKAPVGRGWDGFHRWVKAIDDKSDAILEKENHG